MAKNMSHILTDQDSVNSNESRFPPRLDFQPRKRLGFLWGFLFFWVFLLFPNPIQRCLLEFVLVLTGWARTWTARWSRRQLCDAFTGNVKRRVCVWLDRAHKRRSMSCGHERRTELPGRGLTDPRDRVAVLWCSALPSDACAARETASANQNVHSASNKCF